MNRYMATGIIALLVLVAVLPAYALLESQRMDEAQNVLRAEFAAEGANMYVSYCIHCHGTDGAGIGPMPALNNPALAAADREVLYDTIAHSPHGTAMSAWHLDEGGALSGYQVEGLVTLITSANWEQVSTLAVQRQVAIPTPAAPEEELASMEATGDEVEDPHECRACHEEPEVHASRFGLNCSRCHTLQAWKPAQLTRHTFLLDHGDGGKIACQTCHTENYADNSCYECHDSHQRDEMEAAHAVEDIYEFDNCAECHPTGKEGEAARLGYGRSGQASNTGDGSRGGGGTLNGDVQGQENAGSSAWQSPGNAHGDREAAPGYTGPWLGEGSEAVDDAGSAGDVAGSGGVTPGAKGDDEAGSGGAGAGHTSPANTEAGTDSGSQQTGPAHGAGVDEDEVQPRFGDRRTGDD